MNKTKTISLLTLIVLGAALVLQFQNCSEVEFASSKATPGKLSPGDTFLRNYSISATDDKTVDILFLVDTSGSMDYEHTQIANRFANFIQSLNGLNWRVGISTMLMKDVLQKNASGQNTADLVAGSNGRLIPFAAGIPFIEETTANAATLFSNTIHRPKSCGYAGDDCDDHERGIYNAHLIIDNQNDHRFFRSNADLNMVFVSDENENSDGNPLEALDQPQSLVDKVDNSLAARSYTAHSIIYRPEDNCAEGSRRGTVYKELSELTGGVVGSVCEDDYTTQLNIIANSIITTSESIVLPCAPDLDKLELTFDPVLPPALTYTISGRKVIFSEPLPDGQKITAQGECK